MDAESDKEKVQEKSETEEKVEPEASATDCTKSEPGDAPAKRKLEEEDDEADDKSSNKRLKEEASIPESKEEVSEGAEISETDKEGVKEGAATTQAKDSEKEPLSPQEKPDCASSQEPESEPAEQAEEEKKEVEKDTESRVEATAEVSENIVVKKEIKTEETGDTSDEVKKEKLPSIESSENNPDTSESVDTKSPSLRDLASGDGDIKIEENSSEEKPTVKEEPVSQEEEAAPGVASDGGSDKENMQVETPVDLSNAGTPDVIMLSDEEETEERKKESQEHLHKMKRKVRHLQSELRNEEAKLVLLKKLRQSQLAPQVQDHPPLPSSNNNNQQQSKQNTVRQPTGPPPLVRQGQQGRSPHLIMQQQGRTSAQGQMRNMQGPPPLVGASRGPTSNTNGHSAQNIRGGNSMNQHGSSNHRSVQQQQQQQSAQHQQQQQQVATPPQPPVDTQTPAQRQAAAKLALRKQLEKTLLQIPPPKPPAPEMNFIPSLACPDFVLLLGLEEVVNHIIDLQLIARGQKSPDEKFICNPFTCVQCGTDYTPVWKREKPGSKNVICEHCVTWNQKRALKQEHTNRLKSAFVKALQQEQEIERMQAQTPSAPSTSTPTPSASASSSLSSAPPQALAAAAAATNVAAAMSMNSASYRASAEQVRQHHSFLQQAHQAQLRAGQPMAGLQGFGARSAFPYSLPYVKQADLQRQYLLDMIPRGGMPWKP